MEAVSVKVEPSWEVLEPASPPDTQALVKEENIKEEWWASECGVSEAAMLAGLYADHVVKDELVLGPEETRRSIVAPVCASASEAEGAALCRRTCSVRLERLPADAERRVCRVKRRTNTLDAALQPPPAAAITTKPHQCQHCARHFRNNSILLKHLLHSHSQDLPNPTRDLHSDQQILHKNKPHKCSDCKYACRRQTDLRKHRMTHTGEKPFHCKHCNYKSAQISCLRLHEMTHTGERPFKCRYCAFRCIRKFHLQLHEMSHTGVKLFKCSFCDYKCNQKGRLRAHENTHTHEQSFKCSNCNFKCITKSSLLRHLRVHTGEKPYKCDYCNCRFSHRHSLKRHVIRNIGKQTHKTKHR